MAASLRALLAYLDSFEVAYEKDDWNILDAHFTEDAFYTVDGNAPFAGTWKSREAIKKQFRKICNEFDRRFDARIVSQSGRPKFSGDSILFGWSANYTLSGAPDFMLTGQSSALMVGAQIAALTDIIPVAQCIAAEQYLRDYGNRLKPIRTDGSRT